MAEAVVVLDQLVGGDSQSAAKTTFTLLFCLLLLLLLHYFTAGAGRRTKTRLPPSPPGRLPLIGHAHLIGALPHVSLRGLATTRTGCEDLMIVRLGAVPTLVASSARAAQSVLRTHDQSFASRARSVAGDVLTYGPSDVVFAPHGEPWRQCKKLVTKHLLSAKKVQSYRAARHEEVGLVIDKIHGAAAAGREEVNMSEILSKFTNDMVCRAVAGRSFRVEGRDRVFRELIVESFDILGGINLENFYPGLAKVAGGVLLWPARRRAEKLRDRWIELLDKLIHQHLSEGAGEQQEESDFIHVLLAVQEEYGLTRDNIWGILSDMFAAGTDTTYLVLEFAMAELMLHRDVMTKLQAEVRTKSPPNKTQTVISEDNLAGMTYLKAVIKETLRLHPPAPLLVPHLCQEDCDVDGYTIPSGTPLLVNAWAIGRDPRLWGDAAEEFMPERFIETMGNADFRGMDFQFLPFGSGRRICPGMNFALASIEIMLANLVFHFDWELPRGEDTLDMTEVFRLTASRKEKLLLNPRSRGDNTQ